MVDIRAKAGQTDRNAGFSIVARDGKSPIAIHFARNGHIAHRDANGRDIGIARYGAGRCYNIQVTVEIGRQRYRVLVQDDRLDVVSAENLNFAHPADRFCIIRLTGPDDRAGAWIVYDAICAYHV